MSEKTTDETVTPAELKASRQNIANMNSAQLVAYGKRLDEMHKIRMNTLRALARAKVAEEEAAE